MTPEWWSEPGARDIAEPLRGTGQQGVETGRQEAERRICGGREGGGG